MIAQTVGSASAAQDIDALADEIGAFCGLPPTKQAAALPPAGTTGGSSGGRGPASGSFDANI